MKVTILGIDVDVADDVAADIVRKVLNISIQYHKLDGIVNFEAVFSMNQWQNTIEEDVLVELTNTIAQEYMLGNYADERDYEYEDMMEENRIREAELQEDKHQSLYRMQGEGDIPGAALRKNAENNGW